MKVFSTATVSPKEKLEYWQQLCSSEYSRIEITALDGRNFEGTLYSHIDGPVGFSQVSSSPGRIVRAEKHIRADSTPQYQLFVYREGGGRCFQNGQQGSLRPGDFVLLDISRPYRFEFREFCSAVSISFPEDLLRAYLPQPEGMLGLPMTGGHGLGQVASVMLRSLADRLQSGEVEGVDLALAKGIANIVACAYADRPGRAISDTALTGWRRAAIKRYIEAHLADPILAPGGIARANGISPRYLRLLFAKNDEKVSQYVLRRRLEECAERLRDPAWARMKITDIALSWGFSDVSSFARSFRERYGKSPREYRRSFLIPHAGLN